MKDSSKLLVAVGAGMATGGALGTLLAKEKGSDARKKFKKRARKFLYSLHGKRTREKLEMVKQKLEEHRRRIDRHLQKINSKLEEYPKVAS